MDRITPAHRVHHKPGTRSLKHLNTPGEKPPSIDDMVTISVATDIIKNPGIREKDGVLFNTRPEVEKKWEITYAHPPGGYVEPYLLAPTLTKKGNVIVARGNELSCHDSSTGKSLWSHKLPDAITTKPLLSDKGILYVASSDGKLYGYNAETGERKWTRRWNQRLKSAKDWVCDSFRYNGVGNYMHRGTFPALSAGPDGTVYGSSSSRVFAITEKLGWRRFNVKIGDDILSAPVAGSTGMVHMVVARPDKWGHSEAYILGIDGRTGKEVWSEELWGSLGSRLLTTDKEGNVIMVGEYGLTSYKGKSGEKNFSYGGEMMHRIPFPPKLSPDGTMYFVSGRGFDLCVMGKNNWQAFFRGGFAALPAEGPDGLIYAVGRDGAGCALSKEKGEKIAEFKLDRGAHGAIEMTPDGTIIVADEKGVSGYRLKDIRIGTFEEAKAKEKSRRMDIPRVESEEEQVIIGGLRLPVRKM